jgi:aminopeptidase N
VQGTLHWCHANADEIGFYRQDLAGPLLDRLLTHLDRLAPTEQEGLLGDQWALTRQGSQRMGRFLDVLAALAGADDYNVLAAVVGHLHTLEALVEDTGDEEALTRFHAWVAGAFRDRLAALGFAPAAGETQNAAQQRVQVVDAMVTVAEDPAACREATSWADREAADPAAVDPNVASLLVTAAAQFGDEARFERHLSIYEQRRAAGTPPQETNRYLNSLPAFRDPALVQRVLHLLNEGVLPQESLGPLTARLLTERHSRRLAWDFLKAHWTGVMERLDGWWISRLVETLGRLPADRREDIVAFCDAHLHGQAQQSYARALEMLDQQAEFEARTREDLLAWFKSK